MKKIDLHIHTIPVNEKDAHFEFDMEKFKEYVDRSSLDVIAITNHNKFDLEQFKEIEGVLENVVIFPGIEIDFEGGHLLLIEDNENVNDFNEKCKFVESELQRTDYLSVDKLKKFFPDLEKYLLIPHYGKKPRINQIVIDSLKDFIFAGEVQSPKKFNRCIKELETIVPVLFSDVRISTNLKIEEYQGRQTFIKTNSDTLSFNTIKAVLRDKNKIFLSNTGKHGFFQVFSDGQELSNGLNVVFGGRSSGKTYFLDQLEKIFNKGEKSVKYIKQFDLVKKDEKKFNEIVEKEKSAVREKYLQEFKSVVEDVIKIDRGTTNYKLGKYVETLLEFASSEKLHDEFSRSTLFTETPFKIQKNDELEELINAVALLLKNDTYKNVINKHLLKNNLNKLLADLEKIYKNNVENSLKKTWVNNLIKDVSRQLKTKSSSPNIEHNDIDFHAIRIEKESIRKFNAIADSLKKEKIISEDASFGKFKIQAVAGKYNGAGELHDESRRKIRFAPAFSKYDSPISFLEELNAMPELEKTELYKYFCKVTYQVLNKYDKKVSGGERAEFNLLKALEDARQYEMLLIDEPESSFDNLFLKDNVNKEIKEISKELPVIVVTHNNTVGMLMHPDYILYTQRKITDDKDEYSIFSGLPGDKEFKTANKDEALDSHDILLDALEAGKDAYGIRKSLYNNFKK